MSRADKDPALVQLARQEVSRAGIDFMTKIAHSASMVRDAEPGNGVRDLHRVVFGLTASSHLLDEFLDLEENIRNNIGKPIAFSDTKNLALRKLGVIAGPELRAGFIDGSDRKQGYVAIPLSHAVTVEPGTGNISLSASDEKTVAVLHRTGRPLESEERNLDIPAQFLGAYVTWQHEAYGIGFENMPQVFPDDLSMAVIHDYQRFLGTK